MSSYRPSCIVVGLTLLLMGAPVATGAQGALSNQGFGYPTGQLSTAALATGGATAEFDASSPLNPAAITQNLRYALVFQFEPEFRSTRLDGRTVNASLVRFPTFQATGSYRRFTGSVGVSTLLDRSWVNRYADSLMIGGDWVQSTIQTTSNGAMSDVRAAVGYVVHPRLQIGVGLHGIAGENRTEFARIFPVESGVGDLGQDASISFSGTGVSLGFVSTPLKQLVVAGSFRTGGDLTLEENGAKTATASVPQRYGIGVSWVAFAGASLSARVEETRWTDLDGLGTANVFLFDSREISVGADILGPRVFGVNSVLRAGVRDRTLPFGVLGDPVRERAISFGGGVPFARGRAQLDLAVQRATREALQATERGWFLSVGLGVRP